MTWRRPRKSRRRNGFPSASVPVKSGACSPRETILRLQQTPQPRTREACGHGKLAVANLCRRGTQHLAPNDRLADKRLGLHREAELVQLEVLGVPAHRGVCLALRAADALPHLFLNRMHPLDVQVCSETEIVRHPDLLKCLALHR